MIISILLGILLGVIWQCFGAKYYSNRFEELLITNYKAYILPAICGGVSGGFFYVYGYGELKALRLLVLAGALIVIARIDKQKQIIPNYLLGILLMLRVFILALECIVYKELLISLIVSTVLGAILGSIIFLLAKAVSKESIGMGDIKLLAIVGCYMGSASILGAILVALIAAMIGGIVMVKRDKENLKKGMSFAPYISFGTIAVLMLGA